MSEVKSLNDKETAVAIRKLLKSAFPKVKFSVTMGRGSMVSAVRVKWTDGPTVKRVDAIVDQFQAGNFNGMTDSYDYAVGARVVVDGVTYRPGCRFVHTSRAISAALAKRCADQVVTYWGGIDSVPVIVEGWNGFKFLDDGAYRTAIRSDLPAWSHDWSQMIHQAAADRTKFAREGN